MELWAHGPRQFLPGVHNKDKDNIARFALKLQYAGFWREVFLFPFVST